MNLIIDMDGTMSDDAWRVPLHLESWDAYHARQTEDDPIGPIVMLVNIVDQHNNSDNDNKVIVVTARPERYRLATMEWLVAHKINVHTLLMRGNKDFRSTVAVKLEHVVDKYDRANTLIIDDREDVCMAFRDEGYITMQVHKKDYVHVVHPNDK